MLVHQDIDIKNPDHAEHDFPLSTALQSGFAEEGSVVWSTIGWEEPSIGVWQKVRQWITFHEDNKRGQVGFSLDVFGNRHCGTAEAWRKLEDLHMGCVNCDALRLRDDTKLAAMTRTIEVHLKKHENALLRANGQNWAPGGL